MSLDLEILRALRASPDAAVSGADLSERLKVSRAAIWARIRELRALGYEITASPHLGYRLIGAPDLLHADDLLARLGKTQVIGRDIRVFKETTSTNDVVEKLARDGAKEGAVVFAESQTRGRGRLGRRWVSPGQKGLWFSVLLRPRLRPEQATWITIASGVALRRGIEGFCGLAAEIKWPNDLLARGRKLAGILTELRAEPDQVQHVVLGIGVDVNLVSSDFPAALRSTATSIRAELGRSVSRAGIAVAILRELDREYQRVCEGNLTQLADEWVEHCKTIGKDVTVHCGQRTITGRAESLNEDGALLVRTQHGRIEQVTGGEVLDN